VRVVGNLPYYITSEILLRLFAFSKYFESIVIMVQKEVADRIAAEPGGSEYGVLSATAQLYARVEKLFTLPAGAFVPPPKVQSTVLRLTIDPRQDALGVAGDGFIDFLRLSFGQKRKTLWNNLKGSYDEATLKRALGEARVKPTARAETLNLEQSAAVFRALRKAPTGS
jgi:16S rRNA (adenine1518-N6/adenine1519-N6)-dimethyltransferase